GLKALNIREKILPGNRPHIADSCNNVALICHQLCEYEKALSLFKISLQIYENDDDQKLRIPMCLNNMGLLYLDQHDYDKSIEYYFKALDLYINEDDLKKYHEEIGFTYNNLGNHEQDPEKFITISTKIGNIYHQKGDYDLALEHYQKALNYSDNSPPDLLSSVLMSVGIIYHRQHKYNLALDMYKRGNPDEMEQALRNYKSSLRIRQKSLPRVELIDYVC
ncbi:unnamed protein product, partial [Didymodactylos carnosus]